MKKEREGEREREKEEEGKKGREGKRGKGSMSEEDISLPSERGTRQERRRTENDEGEHPRRLADLKVARRRARNGNNDRLRVVVAPKLLARDIK